MADWYARVSGNNLNAGDKNTDAATASSDAGTALTFVGAVGTNAAETFQTKGVVAGDKIRLAGGASGNGVYTILTVDSETQITLTAAPSAAAYNYRTGGAVKDPSYVANENAGFNVALATGDVVHWQFGAYAQTDTITLDVTGSAILLVEGGYATVDFTGETALEDGITLAGGTWYVSGLVAANAADDGFIRNSGGATFYNCRVQAAGDIAWSGLSGVNLQWCSARACASGFVTTGAMTIAACESRDHTGVGAQLGTNGVLMADCLIADTGGIGITIPAGGSIFRISGCIIANPVGACLSVGAAGALTLGSILENNVFYGGTHSMSFSAAQTAKVIMINNGTFGWSTAARTNADADTAGFVGPTTDPLFMDENAGDYRLKRSSPCFEAATSQFESPNAISLGAFGMALTAAETSLLDSPPAGGRRGIFGGYGF